VAGWLHTGGGATAMLHPISCRKPDKFIYSTTTGTVSNTVLVSSQNIHTEIRISNNQDKKQQNLRLNPAVGNRDEIVKLDCRCVQVSDIMLQNNTIASAVYAIH